MSNDNQLDANNDLPYNYKIDFEAENERGRDNRRRIDIMSGRGDTDSAITNTFMGFNHRIAPTAIPKNRERAGYVFFTRPDLNLSRANVQESPRMLHMAENGYSSAERAILGILDPMCPYTMAVEGVGGLGMDFHPQVPFDNKQAFIPLFTNRITTLSGFPDNTLDVYTSEEGLKREQWSMIDSHYAVNYTFTLNATFQNLDGDVTTQLITTWLEAMSNYYDGTFWPRTRNVIQREKNYETRIYRLIMDPTLTYVTKIGAALAAFPVNDNLGAIMNYDAQTPMIDANDQINVQFHCQGAAYLDPRLIEEFNEVVRTFNPDMVEAENNIGLFTPRGDLRRVSKSEIQYFNWYGYPQIDRNTKELLWFVYEDQYQEVMKKVRRDGNN